MVHQKMKMPRVGCSFLIATSFALVIFYSLYVYWSVRTTTPSELTRIGIFADNTQINLIWNKFSLQNRKCLLSTSAGNLSKSYLLDFKPFHEFNGNPLVAEALVLFQGRDVIRIGDPDLLIAYTGLCDVNTNMSLVVIKKSDKVYLFAHW